MPSKVAMADYRIYLRDSSNLVAEYSLEADKRQLCLLEILEQYLKSTVDFPFGYSVRWFHG
jgi:hypothetical protein